MLKIMTTSPIMLNSPINRGVSVVTKLSPGRYGNSTTAAPTLLYCSESGLSPSLTLLTQNSYSLVFLVAGFFFSSCLSRTLFFLIIFSFFPRLYTPLHRHEHIFFLHRRNKRVTACDYHHQHRRDLMRISYGPNQAARRSLRVALPCRAYLFRYSRDRTQGTQATPGRRGTTATTVEDPWGEAGQSPPAAISRPPQEPRQTG